ncbi:MAG: TetR/AcrR family transcriptional regulator [Firmicutes bacterium]|nr:TetR/AcrR family transcriptional regulator [Bacillota bacterium]
MAISRREANKIKCRHDILKASRRLFKDKGYDDTMIDDVADAAGISKATLYNYFPNKESLLVGTLDDQIATIRQRIGDMNGGNSYEKLKQLLVFLVVDSVPAIDVSRRVMYLNACEASPMYGKVNEAKEILKVLVDQAKEEGVFREDIYSIEIVELLMSIYLNSQFQWKDIENLTEEQIRERTKRMIDLTLSGCLKK